MKKLVCLLVVLAFAGSASAVIVGAWEFEGNFNDTSGYGTPANAFMEDPLIGTATVVVDIERGNVLSLDGGANLVVSEYDTTNVYAGTEKLRNFNGAFTLAAWFQNTMADQTTMTHIVSADDQGPRLSLAGGKSIYTTIDTTTGAGPLVNSSHHTNHLDAQDNPVWTHVAIVYDGAELRIVRDGATVESKAATGTHTLGNQWWHRFTIGGNRYGENLGQPNTNWQDFVGLIDDVFFANHAMDNTEINAIMANGIPEPMTVALLGLGGLFLRRRKK